MIAMPPHQLPALFEQATRPMVPPSGRSAKGPRVAAAAKDLAAIGAQASVLRLLQSKAKEMQVDVQQSNLGEAWMQGLFLLATQQRHMRSERDVVLKHAKALARQRPKKVTKAAGPSQKPRPRSTVSMNGTAAVSGGEAKPSLKRVAAELPEDSRPAKRHMASTDAIASDASEQGAASRESSRESLPSGSLGSLQEDKNDDAATQQRPKRQRFFWSRDVHACFCKAVNMLGIEEARPQVIRNTMIEELGFAGPIVPTRLNVKSHLQKYRIFVASKMTNDTGDMPLDLIWSLADEDIEDAVGDLESFTNSTMGLLANDRHDDIFDSAF